MATSRRQINLRVSQAFLMQLDEVRGGVPREVWIREALTTQLREALRNVPIKVEEKLPGDLRTEPAVAAS